MNEITVDTEKKLITVGGGAIWREVNDSAAEHGLATISASVDHVGPYILLCLMKHKS